MKFKVYKIRAINRSIRFDIPYTARNKGWWVEFKIFSVLIILKSKTIIWEI